MIPIHRPSPYQEARNWDALGTTEPRKGAKGEKQLDFSAGGPAEAGAAAALAPLAIGKSRVDADEDDYSSEDDDCAEVSHRLGLGLALRLGSGLGLILGIGLGLGENHGQGGCQDCQCRARASRSAALRTTLAKQYASWSVHLQHLGKTDLPAQTARPPSRLEPLHSSTSDNRADVKYTATQQCTSTK